MPNTLNGHSHSWRNTFCSPLLFTLVLKDHTHK